MRFVDKQWMAIPNEDRLYINQNRGFDWVWIPLLVLYLFKKLCTLNTRRLPKELQNRLRGIDQGGSNKVCRDCARHDIGRSRRQTTTLRCCSTHAKPVGLIFDVPGSKLRCVSSSFRLEFWVCEDLVAGWTHQLLQSKTSCPRTNLDDGQLLRATIVTTSSLWQIPDFN